ncbi:MAG: OmpA family protein [Desulfobulbaceae bacterium]|nr:OmpA family protein [Desulfobulbaceae bacterium]
MEKDITPPNDPPKIESSGTTAPVSPQKEGEQTALSTERRLTNQPVFVVEDSFYRSRMPTRPAHWSIAWSDLMMTMFVLFLTLFVHQRTHQDILAHGNPNKIADETIPVQTSEAKSSLVFHPISQEVTHKTADHLQEAPLPLQEQLGPDIRIRNKAVSDQPQPEPHPSAPAPEAFKEQLLAEPAPPPPQPQVQPQPETVKTPQVASPQAQTQAQEQTQEQNKREELITGIFDLSKVTLANEKLERFASVELVPDKTMRIILTGDLLFPSGQADLTANAKESLKKLSSIIKKTPYMINVIGHTDSQPVRSSRYPSNWELSLARAGRVARFLIDETKLPATQFSVSGYSSFRPVQPNTSQENRKTNRRVEIILSKELPQAEAATPANLQ